MFEGFTFEKRKIGDTEIACRVAGEGPPVLLLHGWPQSMAMWGHIAPLIVASGYSVVCADLRGYGDSAKPDPVADLTNYSFRAMAMDQIGLMRQLGHRRFHLVGHDRGARTAHRLALDHPEAVLSLTLMDVVPTRTIYADAACGSAKAYWHWYFLVQPAPYPETIIASNPDAFYEPLLRSGMGAEVAALDPGQMAEYRRCWRDPAMIRGSCADYRAALAIDVELDAADLRRRIECPSFVFFGSASAMGRLFDVPAEWSAMLPDMTQGSLPGSHFFPDQFPRETARELIRFLDVHR